MALHSLSCEACKLAPLEQQIDIVAMAIEQAVNDPSIQVRRHATFALAIRRHDPRAVAALEHIQAQETDETLCKTSSRALARVHRSAE
jgi:hypothetical protein